MSHSGLRHLDLMDVFASVSSQIRGQAENCSSTSSQGTLTSSKCTVIESPKSVDSLQELSLFTGFLFTASVAMFTALFVYGMAHLSHTVAIFRLFKRVALSPFTHENILHPHNFRHSSPLAFRPQPYLLSSHRPLAMRSRAEQA